LLQKIDTPPRSEDTDLDEILLTNYQNGESPHDGDCDFYIDLIEEPANGEEEITNIISDEEQ